MCRCGGTKMKLCTCDHVRDEVLVTGCVQQCDDLGRHLKARLSYIHRNATTPANHTTQYTPVLSYLPCPHLHSFRIGISDLMTALSPSTLFVGIRQLYTR